MKVLILVIIVFLHIVDDYYLQGVLASMKQKSWWERQYTGSLAHKEEQRKKYGRDYLIALAAHAFSWSFMINLPWLITSWIYTPLISAYIITLIINALVHAYIDNMKANQLKINLIQDQTLHLIQIIATWLIWSVI